MNNLHKTLVLLGFVIFAAAQPRGYAFANWTDEVRVKAENGEPFAQTTLGVCHELGEGVDKDVQQAVHWYQLAADQGWAGGLVRLGKCYASGIGVTKDSQKAVELWMLAAASPSSPQSAQEAHVQEARAALARAFRLGEGASVDMDKAVAFVRPAAEWGLPEAEYELGMYYLAEGTHRNVEKSRQWLERARDGGFSEAEKELKNSVFCQ